MRFSEAFVWENSRIITENIKEIGNALFRGKL